MISNVKLVLIVGLTSFAMTAQANWWSKAKEAASELIQPQDSSQAASQLTGFSNEELAQAFRQALNIGSEKVVAQLGTAGGYTHDSLVRIPLPDQMKRVDSVLSRVGMGRYTEELELKLNEAAELAAPQAKALFVNAISLMTFEDVQALYHGPNDSATRFLREKTSDDLQQQMRPIIEQTLNEVGAVRAYDQAMAQYKKSPFVPDIKADLIGHTTEKGMEGLFYYLGQKEAEIRENPLEQTTDLLKKVFGR
ncbi:DUF4197 domain-containing protein [Thiomicrospira sp. ALE5]|uniref:DUF4197 domain-containing protein n=1 Tax=Thiomicrospira sp. ALE5 TaxID=748650 RepID=UPI0008E416A9|nr:DUF4197 domain-containing protein [Thiomicrospira sp. ALE5]SFR60437.1 Protein of unknown function [Thiomicrospira sp. ALE5]